MGEKLSLPEAAEIAGITAGTMRMHVLRGKLPSSKPKGRLVIDSDDLGAYLLTEYLKEAIARTSGQKPDDIYHALQGAIVAAPIDARDAFMRRMRLRVDRHTV